MGANAMENTAELEFRPIEFDGSCLCGAVRFNGRGLRDVVYCHCRQCRAGHGATAAYTATESSELTLTEQDTLHWYRSSAGVRREFCARCGSNLFWERLEGRTISIAAGAIHETTKLHAARHIYVADKAPYDEISDDLPQFEASMYV